jgi:hypothetical protein
MLMAVGSLGSFKRPGRYRLLSRTVAIQQRGVGAAHQKNRSAISRDISIVNRLIRFHDERRTTRDRTEGPREMGDRTTN